jgi:hypothetical protein
MTATVARTDVSLQPDARRLPGKVWVGRALSGLAIVFLLFDVIIKLARHPMTQQGSVDLGYPPESAFTIGLIGAGCWVLYAIPRSAILGAVLWTGYLGGAVATHFRIGNPLFSHTLFPLYVAALLWGGLWLRDERLHAVFSPRRRP